MSTRTIKVPQTLFRSAIFDRSAINEEERTVELSISSEAPYERYWGIEILDHKSCSINMSRMQSGSPLLFNHDRDMHIGRIIEAKSDGRTLRVKAKFSRSPLGEEKWQDVKDGILQETSVGYNIDTMVLEKEEEGLCTYRVTGWTPHEGSLVTIPADTTVGVGRGADDSQTREIIIPEKEGLAKNLKNGDKPPMSEPVTQEPKVNIEAERQAGATAFRERAKKINDFAKEVSERRKVDCSDIASDFIYGSNAEKSFDDFRSEVLMRFDELKPVETSPSLGLSKKEQKSFSVLTAIRNIASKRFDGTFEKEVSDAAAKLYRRTNISETTLVLPEDVSSFDIGAGERSFEEQVRAFARQAALWGARAQNVTTATAGGFTVPTVLGSMIELLRNKTVLGQVGVTELSGLQGEVALPVQTGGATAYWVSETGALTDSQATFGQKTLTPHRLGGTIPFTTQFIAQSSLPAEQFVRSELMTVIAIALDLAGLLGTGADGQPLGVANTTGINATVTYGGAATWADVVEHETGIAVDNADIGSMAFILSSATVGKWKTILRDSVAGASYLILDNMTANGYAVNRTNQISAANQSFFGVWSQLIRATWAGIEVIVDPYTLKKSGQVEVTMNSLHDYLVRQPLAFNVSTDSAAA